MTAFHKGTILEMWIGADDKNSTAHIIQIDQMALGLPSREYYLKPTSKKERDAYLKLMIELAVLLGNLSTALIQHLWNSRPWIP